MLRALAVVAALFSGVSHAQVNMAPLGPLGGGSSGGGGGLQPSGTFNAGDIVIGGSATTAKDSLFYGTNGGISMSGGGTPSYGNCYWNDTDTCTTENIRMRERVFFGNAVLMTDTSATCCSGTWLGTNSTAASPVYLARDAQLLSMSDRGAVGVSGMSRFSDNTSNRATIGTAGYGQNNATTGSNPTAYGGYYQCDLESGTSGATNPLCWGIEIDSVNYGANVTGDPYGIGAGASNLWLAAGGAQSPTNPSNFAIGIGANGTTFNEGIMFKNGALTADGNSNTVAIAMSKGDGLKWYLSAGTPAGIITSNAAGQIQFGGMDQAAPVSQTIHAQSVVTGTSNTAAPNFFIDSSQGTGNAGGGTISLRTAPAGGSGSGQNALVQAMGISSAGIVQVSSTNTISSMSSVLPRFSVKNNASGFSNSAAVLSYQASNVAPATMFLGLSRSSTLNTAAAVVNNDQIGQILFDGNDGTNFVSSSAIIGVASGTVSANVVPGVLQFQTATTGGTLTTALQISNAQLVSLPAITTDATHTDSTVCQDTTSHALYFGSGTLGICLGTSSARYKHDVAEIDVGLSQIMRLEPVSYKLNADHGDPNKTLYGFTAEQGGQVLPKLMTEDNHGRPNTFDYLGIVPVLVKAIQQQQAQIDALKGKIR